jgi:hypothetical protein
MINYGSKRLFVRCDLSLSIQSNVDDRCDALSRLFWRGQWREPFSLQLSLRDLRGYLNLGALLIHLSGRLAG